MARIGRAEVVSRCRAGRGRNSLLQTVYYDTPGRLLWRHGVSLRMRRAGNVWIQTVKGAGEEIGGLHSREEIEWVVDGKLNLELLSDTPFSKLFSRERVRTGLAPVFETRFRRRSIELVLSADARALLCLDQGEIISGTATEAICEAEVELLQGEPTALLDFADNLLREVPFRIGSRSKAERGFMMAAAGAGKRPGPVRAGRVDIQADMSAYAAIGAIIQATAVQVHGNEEGVLRQIDPEYLHQMRVGLRRLRVALSLPGDDAWKTASRPLRERFRGLSRLLGDARNWDVFAFEILRPMAVHCGAKPLTGLRSRTGLRRAAARAAACEQLRSPAVTQLWLDLARLMLAQHGSVEMQRQAGEFAAAMLERRHRRLRRLAADTTDIANLHRLRICAKKLRYVSEFFAGLYPRRKVKRFLDALAELQDVLGAINDAATAKVLLARADEGAKPLDAEARGLAAGWIAAGGAQARGRLAAALKAPLEAGVFW